MPHLRINLFGALEIVGGDGEPVRPDTAKVRSLLGYLIAHPDVPHHREKLAELLWPEQPPRRGRRLLSDALWRARRLLDEAGADPSPLVSAGDTIAFQQSACDVWVDVGAFLRLADAAAGGGGERSDIDLMREAAVLYRGDLLEDCYDDWAVYERERLRARYIALLEGLLARCRELGEHEAALDAALRLIGADPLNEEAHYAAMQLYVLLGRELDAARAYERCKATLEAELGVEPPPAATALYEELAALREARGAEEELAPGAEAGPFIGRRAERAALLEALDGAAGGAGGMLLVTGEAGQGKSRLLREIAASAAWRGVQVSWGRGRADGRAEPLGPLREALAEILTPLRARQLAEALEPVWLSELAALLPGLAAQLPGVPPRAPLAPERQMQRQYAAIVQGLLALGRIAPQVILLEDMHWFDRATLGALEAMLPHLAGARALIIASARGDELRGDDELWEMLLRLDRAGLLQRVELAGMRREECDELVRRSLRGAELPPALLERAYAITRGNPFFVHELLRTLAEERLLTRDAQGAWRFVGDPDALPLPAGVQQVISARVEHLSEQGRSALAAAAVLGESFTPALWGEMQGAGDAAQPPDELIRREFLVEQRDGYQFNHSLLREVVYSGLGDAERQELHLRAAEALEREHLAHAETLAHHLCVAGAWAKAVPYLVQAGDHARDLCAYSDALRVYDRALEALARGGGGQAGAATWSIQLKRGEICALLSDYQAALEAYGQVLAWSDAGSGAPRRSAQIRALNGMCYVYGLQNDYRSAREASERSLALARVSQDPAERADSFYHAGLLCYRQDEYDQAEAHLREALDLYEALGLPEAQARLVRCLDALVSCWARREGATDRVLDGWRRTLALCRALGDQQGERDSQLSLSTLYLVRGDVEGALGASEAVLPFFRRTNARDSIAQCQYVRGAALFLRGQAAEALEALGEALALCQETGREAAAQFVQLYIGRALHALGRDDEARRELERASATGDRLIRARALGALAELHLDGDPRRAFDLAAEALLLVRSVGARPLLGRALRVLGQARGADRAGALPPPDDALPDAERCFRESAELLAAARNDGELGETLAAYGQWLVGAGRADEALEALARARDLFAACGMRAAGERAAALLALAEHAHDQGATQVVERRARLRRLCDQAGARGAPPPTVEELALALGVTARTVSRDLAAMRAAGVAVPTRGGRAASHSSQA